MKIRFLSFLLLLVLLLLFATDTSHAQGGGGSNASTAVPSTTVATTTSTTVTTTTTTTTTTTPAPTTPAPPPMIDRYEPLDIVLLVAAAFALLSPHVPSSVFIVSRTAAISRTIVPPYLLLESSSSNSNETGCSGYLYQDPPLFFESPALGWDMSGEESCSGRLWGTIVGNLLVGLGSAILLYFSLFAFVVYKTRRLPSSALEMLANGFVTRVILVLFVGFLLPSLLSAAALAAGRCAHGLAGAVCAFFLFATVVFLYNTTFGRQREEVFRYRKLSVKSAKTLAKWQISLIHYCEPRGIWKWPAVEPDSKEMITKKGVMERERLMLERKAKMAEMMSIMKNRQQGRVPQSQSDAALSPDLQTPTKQQQQRKMMMMAAAAAASTKKRPDDDSDNDSDVPPDAPAPTHLSAGSSIPSRGVEIATLPKTRALTAVSAVNAFAAAGARAAAAAAAAVPAGETPAAAPAAPASSTPPPRPPPIVVLTDSDSDMDLPPPLPPTSQQSAAVAPEQAAAPAAAPATTEPEQPQLTDEEIEARSNFEKYLASLPIFDYYSKNDFWFMLLEIFCRNVLFVAGLVFSEVIGGCQFVRGVYAGAVVLLLVAVFWRNPFTCRMVFYAVVLSLACEAMALLVVAFDDHTGADVAPPLLMTSVLLSTVLLCFPVQIYMLVAPRVWPDLEFVEFDFDPEAPRKKPTLPPKPQQQQQNSQQQGDVGPQQQQQLGQQQEEEAEAPLGATQQQRESLGARLLRNQQLQEQGRENFAYPLPPQHAGAAGGESKLLDFTDADSDIELPPELPPRPRAATQWNKDSDLESELALEDAAVGRSVGAATMVTAAAVFGGGGARRSAHEEEQLDLFERLDRQVRAAYHELLHEDVEVLPHHQQLKRAQDEFENLLTEL